MSTSQFWGTWRLQSFEVRTSSGEVSYPFGRNATGHLIYSQDGYMTVAVMKANRPNFNSADIFAASPDEKRIAFDTFASYGGTYEVQNNKIIHHIQVSLFPNWSGRDQERFFEFFADQLILSSPPMPVGGKEQTGRVVWQRTKLS